MSEQIISNAVNWRYATKKFDKSKIIAPSLKENFLESLRLAPSSFGMQPYKIIVVENEKLRSELKEFSWDQSQITDAALLLVFASKTEITEVDIELHIKNIAQTRNQAAAESDAYKNRIMGFVQQKPKSVIAQWTAKQAYIALGFAMATAAVLKLDTCPMEGFEPDKFNKILKLSEKNLEANVLLTVGYRATDDDYQNLKKVRKTASDLFVTV
ncbi:MAG: NAD(P)H-dependent oxidoreductase [Bacteroidales bacterium]|nr:NAD(P)H-dependent oxidoreductase [Bacteroidales bacterium]